jgi:hypothetical protein
VPSFRCSDAHRIHRKTPSYNAVNIPLGGSKEAGGELTFQLAQATAILRQRARNQNQPSPPPPALENLPGFLLPQSAHLSLPATLLIRSCRTFSLRACWRLFFNIDDICHRSGGEGVVR